MLHSTRSRPRLSGILWPSRVVAALALLAATGSVAGEPIRSPAHGFSYTVIDGWHPVADEAVKKLDAYLSEQLRERKNFTYILSFSAHPGGEMKTPYVLIQYQKDGMQDASVDEVRDAFGVIQDAAGSTADHVDRLQSATIDKPTLDVKTARVYLRGDGVADGVALKGASVILLGKDRTVSLHCYDVDADFEQTLPACQQWFKGMALDPEKVWDPGPGGSAVGVARRALQGALLGGVLGLLIGVVRMVRKRREKEKSGGGSAPQD